MNSSKQASRKSSANYGDALVKRLIELKIRMDAVKAVYAQYDEALQTLIDLGGIPKRVAYDGSVWDIRLIDSFAIKNTAWKSVAQRRYDLSIARMADLAEKKAKKGKRK